MLADPIKLLAATEPTYVLVADRPPLLGGRPRRMPIAELETLHDFRYSESMWTTESVLCETPSETTELDSRLAAQVKSINSLLLDRLKRSVQDEFILAKIDDKVGYGLFANRRFNRGDVVLPYAGLYSNDFSASAHGNYVLGAADYHHIIDAEKRGGLARFIQHMPNNLDETLARVNSYRTYPRECLPLDFFTTDERATLLQIKEAMGAETLTDLPNITLENYAKSRSRISNADKWLMNSSEYFTYDCADKTEVAWSNLTVCFFHLESKAIPVLIATRDIEPYEPIGFSYGKGYWMGKNQLPVLFNKKGDVLSNTRYCHKFVPLTGLSEEATSLSRYYYSRALFINQDTEKQSPVSLYPGIIPQSYFSIRKQLVDLGAINQDYHAFELNSAALTLQAALADLIISIELFRFNPSSTDSKKSYRADILITTDSFEKWLILGAIVESIRHFCKRVELTREILIQGANLHTEDLQKFIKTLPENRTHAERTLVRHRPTPFSRTDALSYFFNQPGRPKLDPTVLASFRERSTHPDPERSPWMHFT